MNSVLHFGQVMQIRPFLLEYGSFVYMSDKYKYDVFSAAACVIFHAGILLKAYSLSVRISYFPDTVCYGSLRTHGNRYK